MKSIDGMLPLTRQLLLSVRAQLILYATSSDLKELHILSSRSVLTRPTGTNTRNVYRREDHCIQLRIRGGGPPNRRRSQLHTVR